MEKRADISQESTPQPEVPPTDQTTTPSQGATKQVPSPPPLLKKGQPGDEHPTAAEIRDQLANSPQKRLADRAADRIEP